MVTEPFLVNPAKHKKHRKMKHNDPGRRRHKKIGYRRNPLGESLMIAGANPARHRKSLGLFRHNTWFGESARHATAARKGWKHRKHGKKMRKNPAMGATIQRFVGFDFVGNLPVIATGVASLILTPMVPKMIGTDKVTWQKYGTEVATTIGGGILLRNFVARKHADAWMLVGGIMIAAEALREFVFSKIDMLKRFADYGMDGYSVSSPTYGPGYADYQVGAFPDTTHPYSAPALADYGAFPDVGTSYDNPYAMEYGTGQWEFQPSGF